MNAFGAIVFLLFWLLVVCGGLGVGRLGRDSRDFERGHAGERNWRSPFAR